MAIGLGKHSSKLYHSNMLVNLRLGITALRSPMASLNTFMIDAKWTPMRSTSMVHPPLLDHQLMPPSNYRQWLGLTFEIYKRTPE